jgi:hypothetical protein
MSKVINLPCVTSIDLPPNRVLQGAWGKLKGVVLIGWDKDNEFYFASSIADGYEVLWLLEMAKKELMEVE